MAILKPLAYLSLPYIALRVLATQSPMARYYLRLVLYISTMGVCSIWGVIVSVTMSLFGNRFNINYIVARSFYNLAGSLLDIRFRVEGEEHLNTRPAVIVGNHQSMLDILYLGRIFPRRAAIMAKKELRWMPGLGQYLSLSGAVFVDRSNNKRAVQSLAEAGDKMKQQNTSLWLFPEGTRSMREHNDMLPFKKGAFHLAVQAGLPVIPVVCENYWRLYQKGLFGSGTLTIRVLPPIQTASLTSADVSELCNTTRESMLEALRTISGGAPNQREPSTSHVIEHKSEPGAGAPTVEVMRPVAKIPAAHELAASEIAEGVRRRTTSAISRASRSDTGMETEEDEGMVLVGRP